MLAQLPNKLRTRTNRKNYFCSENGIEVLKIKGNEYKLDINLTAVIRQTAYFCIVK